MIFMMLIEGQELDLEEEHRSLASPDLAEEHPGSLADLGRRNLAGRMVEVAGHRQVRATGHSLVEAIDHSLAEAVDHRLVSRMAAGHKVRLAILGNHHSMVDSSRDLANCTRIDLAEDHRITDFTGNPNDALISSHDAPQP